MPRNVSAPRTRRSPLGWLAVAAAGALVASGAFVGASGVARRSPPARPAALQASKGSKDSKAPKPKQRPRRQEKARDVSKALRQELQALAKSLGAEDTASDVGLVSIIRSKVAGLKALAETPPKAGPSSEFIEDATVQELQDRLKEMQKMVTAAEEQVFESEARAEGCEVELLYPINSELNGLKEKLKEMGDEAKATKMTVTDLEEEVASLKAALEASNARCDKLKGGLQEIGGLAGTGGLASGLVTALISDEALIGDIKTKVTGLKKQR